MGIKHVLPFVDQHFLLIATLAKRVAQIVYFITFFKVFHARPDAQDKPSTVVAHDMEVWLVLRQGLDTVIVIWRIIVHSPAHLDVDRVDSRPFNANEHLSPGRR